MRYVGGKSRIAKWIMENVLHVVDHQTSYIEPFVGSGAVFARLAPHFIRAACGDAHKDLIMLWRAVASGYVPPEYVSHEMYIALRHAEPSALRGFVGYGASFSGKWFGGYCNSVWDAHHQRYTKPYAQAASRSLVKVAPVFSRADIRHCQYHEWNPGSGDLVYCDPPYMDTLGYTVGKFDSSLFWEVAEKWVGAGALVIVSESSAPSGWNILAERERKAMLRVSYGEPNDIRIERLFVSDK